MLDSFVNADNSNNKIDSFAGIVSLHMNNECYRILLLLLGENDSNRASFAVDGL